MWGMHYIPRMEEKGDRYWCALTEGCGTAKERSKKEDVVPKTKCYEIVHKAFINTRKNPIH